MKLPAFLACALLWMGCGDSALHVYNSTGQDLVIRIGKKETKVSIQKLTTVISGKLKKGTIITALAAGAVLEEVTVGQEEAGRDVIYNVQGKSNLYVVDYSGCYSTDKDKPPTGPPFKILAPLKGRALYGVPAAHFVDAYEMFPSSKAANVAVLRAEMVAENLGSLTVEDHIMRALQLDQTMRSHIYWNK